MSEIGGNLFVVTATDAAQPVLPLPFAADLTKVYVNLATAGTAASTVTVKKNTVAQTPAGVTVAIGATKANVGIVNPYIGVNVVSPAVNNVAPLASFAAGDTVQVVTALGTTAAGAGITLVFEQR
jgi:hypothetical protein